jgi:beta-phosphoglucomutase-like phosphatase (HAD superfamily)
MPLIIFDCDGVLVDTEPPANNLLAETISEEGLPLTAEFCHKHYVGRTMADIQADVERRLGRILPPDWPDTVRTRTRDLFRREGIRPIAHVREQILWLQSRSIPYCVASSGLIGKMHLTLGLAGLLPLVEDVLFSASMVARGKPAPDVFLHAAQQMGAAPDGCTVVEDSLPGIEAGQTAGMRVLAYGGGAHADVPALAQTGAELFTDMRDLPGLLGSGVHRR